MVTLKCLESGPDLGLISAENHALAVLVVSPRITSEESQLHRIMASPRSQHFISTSLRPFGTERVMNPMIALMMRLSEKSMVQLLTVLLPKR